MNQTPTTFAELFAFYDDYVKLLYSDIQTNNVLPTETLYELNAALDHISRFYVYGESEEHVAEKAYSHLKRSCLDIFKLKIKRATDQYDRLLSVDISIIDNGEFERNLHQLYHDATRKAREARRREGKITEDDKEAVPSFELWEPVYSKCIDLEERFFLSPKVDWARVRSRGYTLKTLILGIVAGVIASGIVGLLIGICNSEYFQGLLKKIK
ncbi:MAG: hypothetical protein A2Z18_01695 [Armatimonadetes bacterium RBG_16_58_9]|nr:MAG: hypothetical protein A2Z18_01695 [Armatimonadetes bacterium RBG_16_58_9]